MKKEELMEEFSRLYKRSIKQGLYFRPRFTSTQKNIEDDIVSRLNHIKSSFKVSSKKFPGYYVQTGNVTIEKTQGPIRFKRELTFKLDEFSQLYRSITTIIENACVNYYKAAYSGPYFDSKRDEIFSEIDILREEGDALIRAIRKAVIIPLEIYKRENARADQRARAFQNRMTRIKEIKKELEEIWENDHPFRVGGFVDFLIKRRKQTGVITDIREENGDKILFIKTYSNRIVQRKLEDVRRPTFCSFLVSDEAAEIRKWEEIWRKSKSM